MGRIALVTGGTRGIGEAVSIALKNAGHTVVAAYVGNDAAAAAFKEKTGAETAKFDAGDYQAAHAAVAEIEAKTGPVEILVNNAGVTRDAAFHKMTPGQWSDVIRTNLDSLYNVTSAVWGGMRERGFGRVISIGSVNGQKGQFGQVNYCASKAGLAGFTKALALEGAAKGITVNDIAPGYIATEMVSAVPLDILNTKIIPQIPVRRLGQPEEVARFAVFLADDEAGFITGATLAVNGGQYMT
ncbi:MAG: acetoacetyl-CoA reductase [Rhodospirillales bacterium]